MHNSAALPVLDKMWVQALSVEQSLAMSVFKIQNLEEYRLRNGRHFSASMRRFVARGVTRAITDGIVFCFDATSFAAVLPGHTRAEAMLVSSQIATTIGDRVFKYPKTNPIQIKVAIGVAERLDDQLVWPDQLLFVAGSRIKVVQDIAHAA